jgi:hypothetical protein
LLVRAKDLLERAKLLLWGANRIGDWGRIAPAPDLNLVEHGPEQHPLRLAVADVAATKQMFGAKQQVPHGGGSYKEAEDATLGSPRQARRSSRRSIMKRVLLATAAVLAATVAQAETIYVAPGSATPWHSKAPFKQVTNGNEEVLVVQPGFTNQDLIVVAKVPEDSVIASTNVLMFDDQGKLVENLQVIVTPFGGPSITMRLGTTTYLCGMRCISADKSSKKGMGDADQMTVVTNRDGSGLTSRSYFTPATPK